MRPNCCCCCPPALFCAFLQCFVALTIIAVNATNNDNNNNNNKSKSPMVDRTSEQLNIAGGGHAAENVYFLVGENDKKEILSANKAILSKCSDVFQAMFRFDAENAKDGKAPADNPVEVTDVEIEAFKVMLRFIYSDDSSGLNNDNFLAVLYAAHKYNVTGLINACAAFPIPLLLGNVFLALDQARFLHMEDFACRCLSYIDTYASFLLQSEAFFQIDREMLCEILDRGHLEISKEMELWNAALRWADEQCRQNGIIDCTAEERRAVLGPALYKIRFPLMPREDFTRRIVSSGVLTPEEVISVYQHHLHPKLSSAVPGLYPLQFPTRKRRPGGTIVLDIEGISEFAKEKVGSHRDSDAIRIRGSPWIIRALITKSGPINCLGIFLRNASLAKESDWSCTCSATLRIVSQNERAVDMKRQYSNVTFSSIDESWGYEKFITFTELMDPSRGLYNNDEDKVTLAIDVEVEGL